MPQIDVVIVGGGLAGLACARTLHEAGRRFLLLEASDEVGGRVRTDAADGWLFDRGFQVLLTAYPETQRALDYDGLGLGRFRSGALVRRNGRFHTVADPFRHTADALSGAFTPVGSLTDKLRTLQLRQSVLRGSLEELLARPDIATRDRLREYGFSQEMIQAFFRPFLGGIFLESELITSSRKFEFVFRMFSQGEAALPKGGMQALPRQLAAALPGGSIRCNTPAAMVEPGLVITAAGETIRARDMVLALPQPETARLLGKPAPPRHCSTTCLYFSAPRSPVDGPWLVLNGEGHGPIQSLCVPSDVSPSYAPPGRALVSVTVPEGSGQPEAECLPAVRAQLVEWFGREAAEWPHLRTYRIAYALPLQSSGALSPVSRPVRTRDGISICGDHTDIASIHGAMLSGRRAAEAILRS